VKIGCDFDGTLVDYGFQVGSPVKVNLPLLELLRGKEITIITNQGGLAFGVMNRNRLDGVKYPMPADFFTRYRDFVVIAKNYDIRVVQLQIALYHPKAQQHYIDVVKDELFDLFVEYDHKFDFRIYLTDHYRKPSPKMLEVAEVDIYYGDSDEDQAASLEAGCEYRHVVRFVGS
jgi:histidinol phosphatase-like enzyme